MRISVYSTIQYKTASGFYPSALFHLNFVNTVPPSADVNTIIHCTLEKNER